MLAKSCHHFSITPLLQENICRIGQEVVFSKAGELIKLFTQIEVTPKQIDRVCNFYGGLLHRAELSQSEKPILKKTENAQPKESIRPALSIPSAYEHLKSLSRPGKDLSSDILYAMMDGSFLQFRNEDGSHKDLWKEVKVGRIFFASHQVKGVSKNRNIIRYSDYAVSLGNVKSFLNKMEGRLDDYKGTLVFINDGAGWIWNWVQDAYPKAVQILDYFHAIEYLVGFAEKYYLDPTQKKQWIQSMEDMLNKDQIKEVIEAHQKILDTDQAIGGECKEKLYALLTYYNNNKSRMLYGTYKDKGYLVGSGPIESANRNVIQKRLKLSGQRWTEQGAQNLACLRAFTKAMRTNEIRELIKAA